MRKLRAFSGLIAALFLLGTLVLGASAFTDDADIQYKDAVAACAEAGIVGGRTDGSFDPKEAVTRGEMAKMISLFITGGAPITLSNAVAPDFTDTGSHWSLGYISYLMNTHPGIISGMGDGSFQPESGVTYVQTAKMLLTAMGYDAEEHGFTGEAWDTNVQLIAVQAGLYRDFQGAVDARSALTREEAAHMIYNAMRSTTDGGSSVPEPAGSVSTKNYTLELGKAIETSWFSYSIDHIAALKEYEGKTAGSTANFLVVTLTETNTWSGNEAIPLSNSEFFLQYGTPDDATYIDSEDAWHDSMMPNIFTIEPEESATYSLVFELDAAVKTFQFVHVEDSENGTIIHEVTITLP